MSALRLVLLLAASTGFASDYTALDRYVAAPDPSYRYTLVSSLRAAGAAAYTIDLVSQTWLTRAEVDRPEWRHKLTIIRPDQPATSTVLLIINGGSNPPDFSAAPDLQVIIAAAAAGAIVAQLDQVPNEPLRFTDENKARSEDAIIAYTWDKFLRTGDERWPARLPMTKAVVRAMDTVTAFLASEAGGKVQVNRFAVAGASKRGWTTWSVAAVDPRVIAIAPLVFDALNLEASFIHHFRSYGFWAPAIQDYEAINLSGWLGTPQFARLLEIEDPYQYLERFGLPKYLVASTGDQFFLPDSSRFYFSDLPGEKYIRYVPNTDHGLDPILVLSNLLAWLNGVTSNTPRPRFYWHADRANGRLLVRAVDPPSKVVLWQAANPKARDFRLETLGKAWTSTPVRGDLGIFAVDMPRPAQGWIAFFMELTYEDRGNPPMVFTTEVVVTPDEYPFEFPAPAGAVRAMPRR